MLPNLFSFTAPAPGERLRVRGLHGSSDALYVAQAASNAHPLVVVTASAHHAQRLKEEIPFFAPQLRVALLPDWETLPYDHFSRTRTSSPSASRPCTRSRATAATRC